MSTRGTSKREDEGREAAPLEFVADFQILRILYQLIDNVSNSRCIQKMTDASTSFRYIIQATSNQRNRDLPRIGECGWTFSSGVISTSYATDIASLYKKQTALELHANNYVFEYDQLNAPYAVPPSAMAQV